MEKLSYYYNILYENDLFRTETNNTIYEEWLENNYPPYDKLKKSYKIICSILATLVAAGISISIINKQEDFIFLYTTLGILTALAIKIINDSKKEHFVDEYFLDKEDVLNKIYENEYIQDKKIINVEHHKKEQKNNFYSAIDNFYNTANEYNNKYEIPIFLSELEYKYLFEFLKQSLDKKAINTFTNYNALFLDLLNRTYAKCLYNGKSIEIDDFIEELYNIDESEEFKNEIKIFKNRMNISMSGHECNVYNISGRGKK